MASRETFLVANQPMPNPSGGRPKRRFLQLRGIEDPRVDRRSPRSRTSAGRELVLRGRRAGSAGRPGRRRPPRRWCRPCSAKASPTNWPAAEPPRNWPPPKTAIGSTSATPSCSRDRTWIVVGILKSAGLTFNSEIWAKRSLVASLFGKDTYTTLVLRTKDAAAAATTEELPRQGLQESGRQRPGGNRILRRASPKPAPSSPRPSASSPW